MRRLCALLAGLALAGAVHANEDEFWPEARLYKRLDDRMRLYFSAEYAKGKESNTGSLDGTAALDVSLKPILRAALVSEDWERSRYFWARFGYKRVEQISLGTREVSENRGILALNTRAPLPAEVWFEGRAQADLRWISGSYSTRYRLRGELSRVFSTFEWAMLAYARAEWYYDTRYDAHSRTLYETGLERTLTPHFRVEAYLAWQYNYEPAESSVTALGLVAKWYY